MSSIFDLEGHLAFYRSYHMNKGNVTIHLVCIPLILLSAVTFLSKLETANPYVNVGSVFAAGYGLYYILLDWQLGTPAFAFLVSFAYLSKHYYLSLDTTTPVSPEQFYQYAIFIHIGAWLAQFYGHAALEKRSPALLDSLWQAIVLAPFFVVFEIAFFLGYKKDIEKHMNDKAGVLKRDFLKKEHAKKLK